MASDSLLKDETMSPKSFIINRSVYDLQKFDETYKEMSPEKSVCKQIKSLLDKKCQKDFLIQNFLSWFPIIQTFKIYQKSFFLGDIVGGFTMCIFHIPQGKHSWFVSLVYRKCLLMKIMKKKQYFCIISIYHY